MKSVVGRLRFSLVLSVLLLSQWTLVASLRAEAPLPPCAKLYSQIVFVADSTKLTKVEYEAHLEDLRKIAKGLKSPEFGVYLGVQEPGFIAETNAVMAPTNIAKRLSSSKKHSSKYELSQLDHEIGHALYEKNLGLPHLSFLKLKEKLIEVSGDFQTISREYSQLEIAKKQMSAAEYTFRKNDLTESYVRIDSEFKKVRKTEYVLNSYNELFADLTAAIAQNDPSINADTTRAFLAMEKGHSRPANFKVAIRDRDFSRSFSPTELASAWQQQQSVTTLLGDPYRFFVPIRKHIWDTIAPSLANPDTRPEVLAKVLEAIREQAKSNFNESGYIKAEKFDPAEINADLLRRILAKFASGT